jgi:hypothetical protein
MRFFTAAAIAVSATASLVAADKCDAQKYVPSTLILELSTCYQTSKSADFIYQP